MIRAEKANHTARHRGQIRVQRMCDLLGVSRSGFYKSAARQVAGPTMRERRDRELLTKIEVFHAASDGVYGAPRITADLRDAGETISIKKVAKLMRHADIRGISPRPFRPSTTIVGDERCRLPDLVGRRFDQGELNLVWTSDITYLATDEGWLYLCAVRDGCSRRVLGYDFADSLHTDIVENALRRAVQFRGVDTSGVIFHADRGCQYTSTQLADAARRYNIKLSVGRTGVCWDNAQQESYWSTLKTEFYDRHHFTTRAQAIAAVSAWIHTYNHRRRHSALGHISPVTFEQHITRAAQAA